MTAVTTHLVMSFTQTFMHYELGHHLMGGRFFYYGAERRRGGAQSPRAMRENIPHLAMNSKPFREIRLRLIERERIGEFEIV